MSCVLPPRHVVWPPVGGFMFSVCVPSRACTCAFRSLLTRCLDSVTGWTDSYQTYSIAAYWDIDEHVRFWSLRSKLKLRME